MNNIQIISQTKVNFDFLIYILNNLNPNSKLNLEIFRIKNHASKLYNIDPRIQIKDSSQELKIKIKEKNTKN